MVYHVALVAKMGTNGQTRWPAALLGAVALSWVALAPLAGASPTSAGGPEPPLFTEHIRVEVVELEVLVTDRDGRPIQGLTQDDFRLRVDGEPAEIANFYAIGSGVAAPEGVPGPEARDAIDAALPVSDQRFRLTVAIDVPSLPMGRSRRVLEPIAAGFAEWMQPGDRVQVVVLDGGLEVRQPFTGDPTEAAEAVRAAGAASPRAGGGEREFQRILQDLLRVDPPGEGEGLAAEADRLAVESQSQQLRMAIEQYAVHQVRAGQSTAAALAGMVDQLSGLDGRKVVLYVGGGFEERPGEALYRAWSNKFSDLAFQLPVREGGMLTESENLSILFTRLGDHANTKGVAFYAVAPASGVSSLGMSAEIGRLDAATGANVAGDVAAGYDMSRGAPLAALTAQTGGAAQLRGGDYGGFVERIQEDSRSYYSLGIQLADPDDAERLRRVRVDVDRPGARVRHRASVRPRTPVEKAQAATLAALVHDTGENVLGVQIELGAVEPGGRGRLVLPVQVRFPFIGLLLVPQGEYHLGRGTLLIAAMDSSQDLSSMHLVELPIRVPTDDLVNALQGLAQYDARLEIRPGWHRIAVGLLDEIGGSISTLVAEHEVTSSDGS